MLLVTLLVVTSTVFIIIKSAPGNYNDYSLLNENRRGAASHKFVKTTENTPLFYVSLNRCSNNSKDLLYYLPAMRYNGSINQYHYWLINFIKGNWGTSLQDHMPVKTKLIRTIPISFYLGGIALIVAIMSSLGLAIYITTHNNQLSKFIVKVLFAINALPPYWLALLSIIFLCGGDYLAIFPPMGWVTFDNEYSFIENIINLSSYITLPIICMSSVMLPYLVEQLTNSINQQLQLPYAQTASAKGLSHQQVIRKHVLRNSLIPYITIIAGYVPVIITGSFVVEIIFSIPGIGRTMYDAIFSRNYPLILASTTLVTTFILVSNLFFDMMYTYIDPRIKLYQKTI